MNKAVAQTVGGAAGKAIDLVEFERCLQEDLSKRATNGIADGSATSNVAVSVDLGEFEKRFLAELSQSTASGAVAREGADGAGSDGAHAVNATQARVSAPNIVASPTVAASVSASKACTALAPLAPSAMSHFMSGSRATRTAVGRSEKGVDLNAFEQRMRSASPLGTSQLFDPPAKSSSAEVLQSADAECSNRDWDALIANVHSLQPSSKNGAAYIQQLEEANRFLRQEINAKNSEIANLRERDAQAKMTIQALHKLFDERDRAHAENRDFGPDILPFPARSIGQIGNS